MQKLWEVTVLTDSEHNALKRAALIDAADAETQIESAGTQMRPNHGSGPVLMLITTVEPKRSLSPAVWLV